MLDTSIIHNLDARVKVVAICSFVALTSTMNSIPLLATAVLFLLFLVGIARIPAGSFFKRLLWIIPFGGMLVVLFPFITPGVPAFEIKTGLFTLTASEDGINRAAVLFCRVLAAVSALSLLTSTTGFSALTAAFKELRVPSLLVSLIEFTFRYMFVLSDEMQRMRTARRARCFEGGGSLFNRHVFKTTGQLVGVLFIRSWERGERVYNAMLARGYSGQAGPVAGRSFSIKDLCLGAGILVFALSLRLIEIGGQLWQMSLK
ncbi:Energy-coupling factor transporter transmembrane protein EcfT [Pelotomaculum sp. FP]|nr:Energy-coupling factor transporter transmembrane protein EcfT [Pelotomaculum sp. FP]